MASQTQNGRWVIRQIKVMGKARKWGWLKTMRVARMALMTAYVETNLQNYANANVRGSMALPHDNVGYDHDSVGIMQQRVGYDGSGSGGWGSLKHCQSVAGATESWCRRLIDKGLDNTGPGAWRMGAACQSVQVSAFPDRYAQQ